MLPYEGSPTANILIVGDTVKGVDERSGHYFKGAAGETLDKLLKEAGFSRYDCAITAISRRKPPGDRLEFFFEDKKFQDPRDTWKKGLAELKEVIATIQPNIIIAVGPVAMYWLTGNSGINAYRGYIVDSTLVPGTKVIPVIHPDMINADWKLYFTTMLDFRKAARNALTKEFPVDKRVLEVNPSFTTVMRYLDYLEREHIGDIALDIETISPGSHISILGIADSPEHAVSVSFLEGSEARFDPSIEAKLWDRYARVIEKSSLIMQNGKYDMGVLWKNNGILCRNYKKDIMIAAHAAWPETPRSLGYLASVCLNVPPWKHTANENAGLYNAADAANTYGIWPVLELEMAKTNTRHVHDFEMSQVPVAVMMELQGIKIDRERQKQLIKDTLEERDNLKATIDSSIGRELNFNSPKQVAQLLYEDMALPKQFKRDKKSGENRLTTGSDALAVLCRISDNPVLESIAKYKKSIKLLTFLDTTVSDRNTVHTCYNITGANMAHETSKGTVIDEDDSFKSFGRWSSSASIIEPFGTGNLQNIPPKAREMYDAGEGKVFVQADYKQAEAVVVAYLIQDKKLINLFKNSFGVSDAECKRRNLDVHKITAASMQGFRIEYTEMDGELCVVFSEEVTGGMRKVGKTIRHAKNYSAGPGVLAKKLGVSMLEAKQLMQKYDLANPELHVWQMGVVRQLAQTRILTNLFGRHHKFLSRWGDDMFRSSYSFIPQSTVGDLLNKALVILYDDFGHEIEIRIQLHDAIYIVTDDTQEKIERARWILKHCMIERVQPLKTELGEEFFIDIDFKVGRYWGDLHD